MMLSYENKLGKNGGTDLLETMTLGESLKQAYFFLFLTKRTDIVDQSDSQCLL